MVQKAIVRWTSKGVQALSFNHWRFLNNFAAELILYAIYAASIQVLSKIPKVDIPMHVPQPAIHYLTKASLPNAHPHRPRKGSVKLNKQPSIQ